MAYQSIWYYTDLPKDIINYIEKDLISQDKELSKSLVGLNGTGIHDPSTRTSEHKWLPTDHWMGGFVWHYVQRANRENFLYDLDGVDGENLQYTVYNEGSYYNWHDDSSIFNHYKPQTVSSSELNSDHLNLVVNDHLAKQVERVRKLSFSILLSDPDEYEGGNLQLMNHSDSMYVAPRLKGVMVLFDSRTRHRVTKVTKGVRKSIVGWVVGPRWR